MPETADARTPGRGRRRVHRPAVDLYEYQGKELFARVRIPVSEGGSRSPEQARAAADELGGQVVVKAQVLTGGRGKARRDQARADAREAAQAAEAILGLDINGHVVERLWIERASDIAKEYYLSVTFDRGEKKPLFMLTTEGGIDIEEVAGEAPESSRGCTSIRWSASSPFQARRLCFRRGIDEPGEQKQVAAIIEKLYRAFVECDAMLCEINPLIVDAARARCARSTRSSRSTTTRSTGTRTSPEMRDLGPTRPRSARRARRASRT